MQLLTVVNYMDYPQLFLQAATINKFWKGVKHWTIVIEDATSEESLKYCQLIKDSMTEWTIEIIIPEIDFPLSGWERQQLYKLIYSSRSKFDWVLILDCKNFMIRSMDETTFVNGNEIKVFSVKENEFIKQSHFKSKSRLKMFFLKSIPYCSSMTPFALNSKETENLVNKLKINENFKLNGATEFALYWIYTYNKYRYISKQFVTGFWENVDLKSAEYISFGAIIDDKFKFWTHHRYVTDANLRKITYDTLYKIGIEKKELDLWTERYECVLANSPELVLQSRDNWKI